MMDALDEAACLYVVGLQPSEDLPRIATDAMVQGIDSPSLRELAGRRRDEVWVSRDLFFAALDELDRSVPTEQEALWKLARLTAARITAGRVSPSEGANWICENVAHRVELEGDLRVFIGLASEREDHPADGDRIDSAIVRAAQELIEGSPRQWVQLRAARDASPLTVSRPASGRVPIVPSTLPLSRRLVASIEAWAEEYAATFDEVGDEGGFPGVAEAEDFVRRGQELVEDLQGELGPAWYVEYMPEPIRPPGLRVRRR